MATTIAVLVEDYPYAEDPNALEPDDYAEYCPMGNCPEHGLEGYRREQFEYHTGYDTGVTGKFLCGQIDVEGVF